MWFSFLDNEDGLGGLSHKATEKALNRLALPQSFRALRAKDPLPAEEQEPTRRERPAGLHRQLPQSVFVAGSHAEFVLFVISLGAIALAAVAGD